MKTIVSSVCRAELSPEILNLVNGAGVIPLPLDVLPPRQVKLLPNCGEIPAVLKWHRDAYIPTINRVTADRLVSEGKAAPELQSLLVYSKETYLLDSDVAAMPDEFKRVSKSDADFVVVAVIGENRSPLSVCRNITSGCQDMSTLNDDAKGAVDASNTILIEN